MDTLKWEHKKENYKKALAALEEAVLEYQKNPENKTIRAGLIQHFEFCIELAWKLLKFQLEEGLNQQSTSPKEVVRAAYEAKLINNGELWLKMLSDRNDSSHNYDEALAQKLCEEIIGPYATTLKTLHDSLQ
ncbi:nucleotidyltransferase substrate binding protein [Candidatus Peregrinibacteria bacterium]|nr:MAG: nucleotidyltransferase substrate binding protein [Candidatus Peregrinibacteria bacterium]